MNLQQRLLEMLDEVFNVEREGDDWLVLESNGGAVHAPVRLFVPEFNLSEYATKNAADGLAALGQVDDDITGFAAALSLLSVHIEETVYTSGEGINSLSVTADGLQVGRLG